MGSEPIQFRTATFRSTITRPADTTTYTAEDLVSSATSTVFVLGEAAIQDIATKDASPSPFRNGSISRGSVLNNIVLTFGNNATLSMDGELWFFTTNPATRTDNAAKSFTLAEMQDSFITMVEFTQSMWRIANSASGASGVKSLVIPNIDWPEQCQAFGSTYTGQIWVAMVAKNAYVPVSAEVMSLKGTFTRD